MTTPAGVHSMVSIMETPRILGGRDGTGRRTVHGSIIGCLDCNPRRLWVGKNGKQAKRDLEPAGSGAIPVQHSDGNGARAGKSKSICMEKGVYEKELRHLEIELVKLQEWVKHEKLKVVVIFEGRDAAGKGGVIKRITEPMNPRVCRVVALAAPTEREKTQWYFQRYVRASARGAARSSCSTAAGTTARASSGSWASARTKSTWSSCTPARSSSACWCGRASS